MLGAGRDTTLEKGSCNVNTYKIMLRFSSRGPAM